MHTKCDDLNFAIVPDNVDIATRATDRLPTRIGTSAAPVVTFCLMALVFFGLLSTAFVAPLQSEWVRGLEQFSFLLPYAALLGVLMALVALRLSKPAARR